MFVGYKLSGRFISHLVILPTVYRMDKRKLRGGGVLSPKLTLFIEHTLIVGNSIRSGRPSESSCITSYFVPDKFCK